jgi:hypothetical protein
VPEITKISVTNESEAWGLLEKAVLNGLPKGTIQLEFTDWYNHSIKFSGDKYNSTITTSMMQAFIDLQKMVNSTYCKLNYDQANRRLTDTEKKSLEIFVKVEPGSSDYTAILSKAIDTLTKGAVNEMESTHYVIIIVSSILCLSGVVMWRQYLKYRSEAKHADLDLALSKEESHRLEIFGNAMKREPYVESIKIDSDEFKNAVIKSAKSADTILVADQLISKDQAEKLVRSSRVSSEEVRIDGEYRITKVDSKDPDFFKVYLVGNGWREFSAILDMKTIISGINLELLKEAEWGQKPIQLSINATVLRGDVTTAKIIDVSARYIPES